MSFFADNYSRCWDFLTESRWHVVFSLGIFSLFFLIGFMFPIFFRQEIADMIAGIILSLEGLNTYEITGFILLNNIKASFFAMVFGIGFGIFPLITGIFNGYILGFVARFAVEQNGIFTLWKLVPHGIFELPAIILSIGIGMKIGVDLFRGKWKGLLKYNLGEGLRFFVFVILPLLIVAGIIEGILVGALG